MRKVDTIIIGAGHAGLSVSYCLSELEIEHVVLERGAIANSWRKERWDSLTLLTPNWQTRLPGFQYSGDHPDAFMSMPEVIRFIEDYAEFSKAPVETETEVTRVTRCDREYQVETTRDTWCCRCIVIASGACNRPAVPALSAQMPEGISMFTPHRYRSPRDLPNGGVLMVGASATGLQLAAEINDSGRPVTIAVGEHVRLPRTYRGRDIMWYLNRTEILDEGLEEIDDIVRARNLPSPQLVGSRAQQILDLNAMSGRGIRIVGRVMSIHGGKAIFSGSLRNVCALADLKMGRLLDTIDEWAESSGHDTELELPERFPRTLIEDSPPLSLDLNSGEFKSVFWATGYTPDYSWLEVPVLDRKGRLRHDGGVVSAPGLYVVGLPFLRRRKSSFIHGAEDDARHVARHLAGYLRALSDGT